MTVPATPRRILACVRARGRLLSLWTGELWRAGETSPDQGLAITAAEAARHLADPDHARRMESGFYASDPDAAGLAQAVAAVDRDLARDKGWRAFCGRFGLSEGEAELAALCLATAYDPALGRVFAYLQDDGQAIHPTPLLAARLFRRPPAIMDPAALIRWRLASPLTGGNPAELTTAWAIDPAVALSLAAGAWSDPVLDGAVRLELPGGQAGLAALHGEARRELEQAIATLERPLQLDLCGTEGIGRATLALQVLGAAGQPTLVLDWRRLLASGRPPLELLVAGFRMARSAGAVPVWRDAALIPADAWIAARGLADLTLCCWPPEGPSGPVGGEVQIKLGPLSGQERLQVWRDLSAASPPPIVATQRLTPAEIGRVVRALPAGEAAVRSAVRRSLPRQEDLLSRLPTPYTWDDLVLAPDLTRQLHELAAQIELRWAVYEDWGFQRLTHLGCGITALFGGPSGVGKTMAAQVIANALALDLYRVDLAGVVNKYVGETEKRLREVFDYCERAGALLFFDEADALFGSRMQVKDAHDRFANIEIDYLLQRIERFDGVAILATNRKNDLDSAFLRRLRVVVDFMPPAAAERLLLWRKALLPTSPSGEALLDQLDWHFLAERLAFTGAEIKAAALGAAFLARAEGGRIAMRHVLAAAQREMVKSGQVLRTPLREAAS